MSTKATRGARRGLSAKGSPVLGALPAGIDGLMMRGPRQRDEALGLVSFRMQT